RCGFDLNSRESASHGTRKVRKANASTGIRRRTSASWKTDKITGAGAMTDFSSLIPLLVNNSVEFIIVGGAAATAHGASRLTEDLDIVYRRTKENVSRLVESLTPCTPYLRGAPPGLPFIWDESTILRGMNFTLTTSLGAIDLLGEIAGGGAYDNLIPDTIRLPLFGVD